MNHIFAGVVSVVGVAASLYLYRQCSSLEDTTVYYDLQTVLSMGSWSIADLRAILPKLSKSDLYILSRCILLKGKKDLFLEIEKFLEIDYNARFHLTCFSDSVELSKYILDKCTPPLDSHSASYTFGRGRYSPEMKQFLTQNDLFDQKAVIHGLISKDRIKLFKDAIQGCQGDFTGYCVLTGAVKCLTHLAKKNRIQTVINQSVFRTILTQNKDFLVFVRELGIQLPEIIPEQIKWRSLNTETIRYCVEEGIRMDQSIFQHYLSTFDRDICEYFFANGYQIPSTERYLNEEAVEWLSTKSV